LKISVNVFLGADGDGVSLSSDIVLILPVKRLEPDIRLE
jgi:hypothetical protein